ncbi:putative 14.4 kDa protein in laf 3'region [Bienertia sinuspersici]
MIQLRMEDRTCIRDLAAMLNLNPTTVWRMIKRGLIKPHTNPLHPGIKEANMLWDQTTTNYPIITRRNWKEKGCFQNKFRQIDG